jgi:hypothetical protein
VDPATRIIKTGNLQEEQRSVSQPAEHRFIATAFLMKSEVLAAVAYHLVGCEAV